jgi:NADPH:quinone reductase-like Zn-dependent oxidoreductase
VAGKVRQLSHLELRLNARQTMKAVVRTEYGPPEVVRVEEVPKPAPAANEVLIRVVAASINGSDREAVIGRPAYARIGGLRKPRYRILGSDIAGRVEQVGSHVRDLQPGDEILGEVPGYRSGFAEYVSARESAFVRKPAGLTFEEAAAIPQAGAIALQGICIKGQVRPGQKVLINGAGGAAGSFAVQIAKLAGAEVTGVDHGDKADFLRSLGADHVVDYTRDDFTRSGEQYDLVLDTIAHRSVFACARALRRNGVYFFAGGAIRVLVGTLLMGPWIRLTNGKNLRLLVVPQDPKVLLQVTELCAQRRIVPAIDRSYPLSEAREALRYVVEGRNRGKVVITFEG